MSINGQQIINIGLPNESIGSDPLYTAFNKIKDNFSTLFTCASPYTNFVGLTGIGVTSNANTGTVSITNTGVTNIIAGANITIDRANGNVTITSTGSGNSSGADLAEYYQADAKYEPGTVLMFGGDKEVTLSEDATTRVAGVVSTNPAYAMNSGCPDIVVAIALQGRVPCKVQGTVRKGDMMISAGNGYGAACSEPRLGQIIGKALENFDLSEGVIEIVVGRL